VHLGAKIFGTSTKLSGKLNFLTTMGLSVKDRPSRYASLQHLFKAYGLCAELHQIAVGGLAPAAFVFDRIRFRAELHHIASPRNPKPAAVKCKAPHHTHRGAPRLTGAVHCLMQQTPLSRESVLFPRLFEMDKCPLPRTKRQML